MGRSYETGAAGLSDRPIGIARPLWLTAADERGLARRRRRGGGAVLRRGRGVADPGGRAAVRRARDGHDPSGVRAAGGRPAAAGAARRLRVARDVLHPRADRRAPPGRGRGDRRRRARDRPPLALAPQRRRPRRGGRAGGLRARAARAGRGRRDPARTPRRAVGGVLAHAGARRRARARLRLEPDGRRFPVPPADAGGDDRRAASALEPGRLGAVRVPAPPGDRRDHPVAAAGGADVDPRAGRDAAPRLAVHAHLPPVPLRPCRQGGGAADRDRGGAGPRRRHVRHLRADRRPDPRRSGGGAHARARRGRPGALSRTRRGSCRRWAG